MNRINPIKMQSLIAILENGAPEEFPSLTTRKNYVEKFRELDNLFSTYPIEMGAMKNEIENSKLEEKQAIKQALLIKDPYERKQQIDKCLSKIDRVVFLNKHGPEHTQMVRERALDILRCFSHDNLTYYELFILLCAISVHDVGNMLGRKNHEKRIRDMINAGCKDILDSFETQSVSEIAGVHSGK